MTTSAPLSFGWSATNCPRHPNLPNRSETTWSPQVFVLSPTSFEQSQQREPLLLSFVETGQPSRETLHGSLKLRM
jgi:hypothetical protein